MHQKTGRKLIVSRLSIKDCPRARTDCLRSAVSTLCQEAAQRHIVNALDLSAIKIKCYTQYFYCELLAKRGYPEVTAQSPKSRIGTFQIFGRGGGAKGERKPGPKRIAVCPESPFIIIRITAHCELNFIKSY